MNNILDWLATLLAQTPAPEAPTQAQAAATGMRWDGWLMLIIGILLLYGGLAWCLWIAAGKGAKEAWSDEEDAEP